MLWRQPLSASARNPQPDVGGILRFSSEQRFGWEWLNSAPMQASLTSNGCARLFAARESLLELKDMQIPYYYQVTKGRPGQLLAIPRHHSYA